MPDVTCMLVAARSPISTGFPMRTQFSRDRRKLPSPNLMTRSPLRASSARTQAFAWPCIPAQSGPANAQPLRHMHSAFKPPTGTCSA